MLSNNAKYPAIAASESKEDSCPVLFPMLDIPNHKPMAPIEWIPGTDALGFTITEDVRQSEEVWNDYGRKSNEECMFFFNRPSMSPVPSLGSSCATLRSSNCI